MMHGQVLKGFIVNQTITSFNDNKPTPQATEVLLLDMSTLCQRIGLCRSNVYLQIQAGKFPEPVKIGRSSRWLASEIHAWVNAQACARSPKTSG
jgi:predicted DNA-binding transcriptional regulator AlpA